MTSKRKMARSRRKRSMLGAEVRTEAEQLLTEVTLLRAVRDAAAELVILGLHHAVTGGGWLDRLLWRVGLVRASRVHETHAATHEALMRLADAAEDDA